LLGDRKCRRTLRLVLVGREEAVAREDLARAIALLGALRQEEGQELTMQWVAAAEQRRAAERQERQSSRIGHDFYKGFGTAF
jgi:hypothetical protein